MPCPHLLEHCTVSLRSLLHGHTFADSFSHSYDTLQTVSLHLALPCFTPPPRLCLAWLCHQAWHWQQAVHNLIAGAASPCRGVPRGKDQFGCALPEARAAAGGLQAGAGPAACHAPGVHSQRYICSPAFRAAHSCSSHTSGHPACLDM